MKSVLIVDDNPDFLQSLHLNFAKHDFATKLARNGPEAIAQLDKFNFDLIVLDLYLPGNNAIELLHEINSYDDTYNTSVYLYSSYADNIATSIPALSHYGVIDIFDKGEVSPKNLVKKVAV